MKQALDHPRMSIDIRRKRIRIHKVTLELLRHPQCILLLVNPGSRTIAVMPSADVKTAHRIHWELLRKTYEITSINFIRSLRDVCTEWTADVTYRITGEYIPSENIVEFRMDEAVPIQRVQEEK
ncbi:MAG: hypothetical protein J6I40_07825 [Mailhella sp.]|nr:hypothetical protein [Mailhella sp.]